jgi:hypothetical protein
MVNHRSEAGPGDFSAGCDSQSEATITYFPDTRGAAGLPQARA